MRPPSGSGDDEDGGGGHETHPPSAEERVQVCPGPARPASLVAVVQDSMESLYHNSGSERSVRIPLSKNLNCCLPTISLSSWSPPQARHDAPAHGMFSRELIPYSAGHHRVVLSPHRAVAKLHSTPCTRCRHTYNRRKVYLSAHQLPPTQFSFRVVQALRATRDRERGKLRALIAEKRRRTSIEKAKAAAGGEASPQGGAAPHGETEPDEPLLPRQEWSSPRGMAAAGGGGRRRPADRTTGPPASEPRGGRCRGTPQHRVACPKGEARSGSVNASTRRRRRPGSDYKNDDSNQEGDLNAEARR